MKVIIEPLVIGGGPIVYILVRQIGRHKDIEQMPDSVTTDRDAHAYAAKRWNVPECDVKWMPQQAISIEVES